MLILDGLFYIATLFVIVKLPRDFLMNMLSFRDFTLFSDIFCNMTNMKLIIMKYYQKLFRVTTLSEIFFIDLL